jgi:hypothetical protein
MDYPKPVWDFEKPDRTLTPEETTEASGSVRTEPSDNGPVTFGCPECARLHAWMRDLATRAENDDTLPRVAEYVACWKARKAHEQVEPHVAFGWAFDRNAVKLAESHFSDPVTGPFWKDFKTKYLMPTQSASA